MAALSGVCAIIPKHQKGCHPKVIGMGIVVNDLEVLTCAHVVDQAIGEGWFDQPGDGVLRICFPYVQGEPSILGTVDRTRYFRANRAEEGALTDIAVVELREAAPNDAGRAILRTHTDDAAVKVFGFRCKALPSGDWESHPNGEIAESKIVGALPGGRVYFEGIRITGASVEPGFSGAGVNDTRQGAVVGMVVAATAESGKSNAQLIDVACLQRALGKRPASQPPSTSRIPDKDQYREALLQLTQPHFDEIVDNFKLSADMPRSELRGQVNRLLFLIDRPGTLRERNLLRLKSEIERFYPDAFTNTDAAE